MTYPPQPGEPARPNPYPAGDPFAPAETARYQPPQHPPAPGIPGQGGPTQQYPVANDPYVNFVPPPAYPAPAYGQFPQSRPTNSLAIAALIASLVGAGLGPFTCGAGLIGSIAGPIMGAVALNQIKETGEDGRGLALGGIIVGLATIALCLVAVLFVVGMYGWAFSSMS